MTEQKSASRVNEQEGRLTVMAGKYLTFQIGKEIYGLEILKVQEIIGMMNVTRIPRTPEFVRGVINLRGKVITVIDLRRKFEMEVKEDTEKTCIVVVQVGHKTHQVTLGTIVDEVSEVLNINQNQIEPPPAFGENVDVDFILGMGKVGQKVIMLLDINKVLTGKEVEIAEQTSKQVS